MTIPSPNWRIGAALLALLALLGGAPGAFAAAAVCSNPGKDGPVTVSGVVNSYYPGSTVSAGSTSIPVGAIDTSSGGSSTAIGAGDLVLVMQMQDADINSTNTSSYGGSSAGSGQTALNNSGVYEYATVASTYAGGSPIALAAPLKNSYRTAAYVAGTSGQRTFQVIRVPQYSSATLGGTVLAAPWNGATGGVMVFDVGGQLNWSGQIIDVQGRGFRGGGGLYLKGADATQTGWASTDYASTLSQLSPVIAPNPSSAAGPFRGSNGAKGEGIAGTSRYLFVPSTVGAVTNGAGAVFDTGVEGYPNGTMARGAPGNAGGGGTDGRPAAAYAGGNDQNTGGGGGGGYAAGGSGGFGWTPGTPPGSNTGGFGGAGVPMAASRLTLGGGGGAGVTNNGTGNPNYGLASSGAAGGGIVLIRARTITGSGTINANGTAGNQGVCNDASGGGGGGGSVLVFASGNNGNVGTLVINASGGMGGSNTGNGTGENATACGAYNQQPHGPGGGGGGGFAALSSTSNATINVAGSANGTTSPSPTSTAPYGSSSSPGGYQISSVVSTDVPGSGANALCSPLLTTSKVTTKSNTVQGGVTSYTITVGNGAAYGTATGVALSDALPSPFTFATTDTIALAGGATRTAVVNPTAGATSPSWGTFTIPGGGSVAISFTVNVPVATALGTYQNPASVTYDDPTRTAAGQKVTPGGLYTTGDFVPGSNYLASSSTQEDVTVWMAATVTKTFSPVSVVAGGTALLNILIGNPNSVQVTGAAFNDVFPSGLTAVGGSVTMSGCTAFGPSTIAAGATSFSQSGGTIPANGTCTFSVSVATAAAASYTNTLPPGALSNNLNVTNVAPGTGTLLARPSIAKSFSPAAVSPGVNATLSFAITNPNSAQALTGTSFTDTFPAGLVASAASVTVTGAGCTGFAPATVTAGATSFALTAGTLPALGTCTVAFPVSSAILGNYVNTAGGVTTTETVAAGAPSNAAALAVGEIGLAKSFNPTTINSGGTSTVTLTLTNPAAVAQTGGAFSDTLTGMSISGAQTVGGTCVGTTPATLPAGQTSLSFTGINIPASSSCTVTFVVASTTVGTQTNTAGGVRTALLATGPASNTASLVVTGAPTIAKAFNPTTIQAGQPTTVTFTLVSNDSITLTSAGFTDALNANLMVAGTGTIAAGGTCAGASSSSFAAGAAGATLTFSGLSIPSGAGGCTVTIPLTSNTNSGAAGYANSTSGVSSAQAATGAASNVANLVVVSAPTIAKAFGTSPIAQGGTSTVTFTLGNTSAIPLTGASFTDPLTNLAVASTGAAGGTCAGASSNSFTAGQTGSLSFSGITIPPASNCTVTLDLKSSTAGAQQNTASGVTTAQTPVAGTPSNTATVIVDSPPQLAVGFAPGLILSSAALATSSSTMTITLSNVNSVALTGVAFADTLSGFQIYQAGAAAGTCTGASGNSFAAGATSLSFTGLTVPANGSCTVTVKVSSGSLSPPGGWPNSTGGATSTQTPTAGAASPLAYLDVVTYATIAKGFSPAAIAPNGTSTLTFTLDNSNSVSLTAVKFSDTFPAGLTTTNVAQNYIGAGRGTCTGAIPSAHGAGALATSVTFSGISMAANSTCTVMVDVTANTGSFSNTASGVTASETGIAAGPVSNTATLGSGQIAVAKAFGPASIGVGEKSTITFTLTNGLNTAFTNVVNFSDTFPAGMTVAATPAPASGCGGTLRNIAGSANSAPGDTGFQLVNGSIGALASCTITVPVTTSGAGSFSNTTSTISWGSGTGPASNTALLTVVAKPTISKAFSPTAVDAYRNSTLTFTLTNPNASAPLSNCTFTDALGSLFVSNPPSIGGTCVGVTGAPAYGATNLSLGIPTLNAGSCTISVQVTGTAAGVYPDTASGVLCSEIVSAGAGSNTASLTLNKLPIQLIKSANLANVPPGSAVTYTITYTNPNSGMALQNIVITDLTPQYTTFASASCGALPASLTSCGVTAPAAGATGTITWTLGGSLNAGASGTVTLTVMVN
jgi:mucin-19